MIIIGVDFHPEFQQVAFVDTETGELQERRLKHPEESRELLPGAGEPIGSGASRHGGQWTRAMVRAAVG
jgi:hypothetical protein